MGHLMSDPVRNPKDWFSRVMAHILVYLVTRICQFKMPFSVNVFFFLILQSLHLMRFSYDTVIIDSVYMYV